MLQYILERFETTAEGLSALAEQVTLYTNSLITHGYLARDNRCVMIRQAKSTVQYVAIIGHPTAIYDAADVPHLKAQREEIEKLSHKSDEFYFDVSYSEDEHYCAHEQWSSIRMRCDEHWGVSPFICGACGGIIARYRIKSGDATVSKLWEWDTTFRHVAGCWLISGDYELWAKRELDRPDSALNRMGIMIAKDLSRQNDCIVQYEPRMSSGEQENESGQEAEPR